MGGVTPYLSADEPHLNFRFQMKIKMLTALLLQWPLDGRSKNLIGASQEGNS